MTPANRPQGGERLVEAVAPMPGRAFRVAADEL
jgi:hypothetical protein